MFRRLCIQTTGVFSAFRFIPECGFIRSGLGGLLVTILVLTSWTALSFGEIYTYMDPEGVIHFSDTPPDGKNALTIGTEPLRRVPVNTAEERLPLSEKRACGHQSMEYCNAVIHKTSKRYGLDPNLVHAVVKAESDYNPYAISRRGAMGIMQLMPETARDLSITNLFSIEQNIDGGVRYLSYLMDRFPGNLTNAIAAYNAGPNAVERYHGTPPYAETRNYVSKVFRYYKDLGGSGQGRSATPAIYKIVREDGSMLFTNMPAEYIKRGRGEIAKEQEL